MDLKKNEVPYKDVLHKVDIPTETWPAQDIRKAYVLNCVSKYVSEQEREAFLKKRPDFFSIGALKIYSLLKLHI